jgi:hypothetical protein
MSELENWKIGRSVIGETRMYHADCPKRKGSHIRAVARNTYNENVCCQECKELVPQEMIDVCLLGKVDIEP